ncbi:PLP-dependent aminotransferase family protein [Sporosarcina psychrophila]|uniref:MocR-like transcriptional regulator GabR n=1 Tax=Sporosarcina psychrophila TaxID=1476 RepID=UPI00078D9E4E|nr:PLP-dependent aminotransferase family protein [Sporosarcina psychrophila]AMQ07845.1 GntR family transcriptional regulator [Sporosarcina psychrophila]
MINFYIDKGNNSEFIYNQICEKLKKMILEHKIKVGEKLPSKRQLANDLMVSVNSVSTAYEQLLAEGYIYTIERKGYFVEDVGNFINKHSSEDYQFPKHLKEKSIDKDGWLSLSHINTDDSMFPFPKWMNSQQKAIYMHKNELSQISHPQGPLAVRETISNMVALTRGVNCEPEQIVINTGTQPLIQKLMSMQLQNIKVAVENPGYVRIFHLLKSLNLEVSPISLDNKGINFKEFKKSNSDFLIVTPSHQFPTGVIMPISRRIEILNWAAMHKNRYIIEDDYDSEFKYGTDNIPSLQSLDKNNRVIYIGSFSKTLLPSFRISYMILPPKLLELYKKQYYDWSENNTLHLYALHYFIQSGEYAKHIKRMNQHYNKKRKYLINELYLKFKKSIYIKDVPAGLHIFIKFNTNKTYSEIIENAQQEKLEIYTIKRFLLNDELENMNNIQLVIGFASIKEEDISDAVERLYRVIY